MAYFRTLASLLADAARGWSAHGAQRMGAALAFYTTLAAAPLAVVAVSIAGFFFGEEAAKGRVVARIEEFVGREEAMTIEALIQKASAPQESRIATTLGLVLLIVGASGVFAELKDSLDAIWEVKRKPGRAVLRFLKTEVLAFSLMVGTGFLLLVSLILTTVLSVVTGWLGQWLPFPTAVAHLLDMGVSFLVITLLFALVFKFLPDVNVPWRNVWLGSAVTAALFMIGKSLISFYIGSAGVGSIYGAAGSLVVVLVWMYYSAQIVFFGAELIRAYTLRFDPQPVLPTADAEYVGKGKKGN